MSAKILIVEDDATIRQAVSDELKAQGWQVSVAADGDLGLKLALDHVFDCLVLDLMLPRVNGYEICKALRREGKQVPILMMSAKGEEQDVLRGFHVGTTDYLRKPFSLAELIMRIKVHIGSTAEREIISGGYSLDVQTRSLTQPDGTKATLTDKEAGVLCHLMQRPGTVLTRQTLLNEVWGNHWTLGERSVDRCIKTLRKKLLCTSDGKSPITTIRQGGYSWNIKE